MPNSHGLLFNTAKTQLICFRSSTEFICNDIIFFGNTCLDFSNSVTHLGHRILYNLKDKEDILRAIKDLNRKANSVLCTFSFIDILTLCFLIKTYCLSLYGCTLWSLSSASLKLLQTSFDCDTHHDAICRHFRPQRHTTKQLSYDTTQCST